MMFDPRREPEFGFAARLFVRSGWPGEAVAPYAARMAKRRSARQSGQSGNEHPWEVRFPLTVFLVHWIIIQGAAWLSLRYGTVNGESPPYGRMPGPMGGLAGTIVEPFRQWDGLWYKLIAETGYIGGTQSAKAAFWPLYPWLMRSLSQITGIQLETAGYIISNVAFAAALVILWRLLRLDFDDETSGRALWALALFPTAFFFQAVYTESLFLVLAAGALLAARMGRWWVAGAVGALSALTRSYGVLLGLPFLFLLWDEFGSDVKRWWPSVVPATLPALGPAIFGWHLHRVQGNALAFVDVQAQWNRYSAMPWQTLRCAVESCFFLGGEPDGVRWDWLHQVIQTPQVVSDPTWRMSAANS
ncbi:MAG: mannosyltransferase family protein, partial [Thermomicrobiales bacterium]